MGRGGSNLLEIEKINVAYGFLQVLYNINLKVNEKETIAVVGPNGAGKSTLIRTICGLLHPISGSITFLKRRIESLPPHEIVRLGISTVPEGRKLFPEMTVLENLKIGACTPEARKKLKDTLEWVFNIFPVLKERKKQLARTLSGGEQQMLAMARALMSRPKLYLLDEPSLGLAPKLVDKIFEILRQLREEGLTILLVEQHVAQALELADRAYLIEGGRIALEGSPADFIKNVYIREAYLGL